MIQSVSRLNVVVGHFGSGKTEYAVNLALRLAEEGRPTALADLDVVDPYFRSRENQEMLRAHHIRLITSSPLYQDADLPSMPAEVEMLFENQAVSAVLDIGGDASGARVLARYRQRLCEQDTKILCVINANRPLTNTAAKALAYLRDIENASGMKIGGLVNNTHLCDQTTAEDICLGARMAEEVSGLSGIPIVCHMAERRLCDALPVLGAPVFPIDIYMKKPWER